MRNQENHSKFQRWPLFFTAVALLCCLTLTGCSGVTKEPEQSYTTEPNEVLSEWAVYIYLCGADLEYHNGSATKNIAEILSCDFDNEKLRVVIETGGCKQWRDYDISGETLSRYEVEDGALRLIETAEPASMGSASTLADFLDFAEHVSPAEHTMLVLWDHGGGAAKGVCFDPLYGHDALTLLELGSALQGRHYDIVGFDACLMAGLEEAVAMAPYADYMVASQALETKEGWDYAPVIGAVSSGTVPEDVCRAVCDGYMNKNSDAPAISAVDLKKIDVCKTEFEQIIQNAAIADAVFAAGVAPAFGGNSLAEGHGNMVDLGAFCRELCEVTGIDESGMLSAIDDAVVCNEGAGSKQVCGLSVFYPVKYDRQCGMYCASTPLSEYKAFLEDHYSDLPDATIVFEDSGFIKDDSTFSIRLSEESKKYVRDVTFLWAGEYEGDDTIVPLGFGSTVISGEDGTVYDNVFRAMKFTLDGKIDLFVEITFKNDRYVLLAVPILLNGESAVMNFRYAYEDDTYRLLGASVAYGEDDAGAVLTKLNTGDTITALYPDTGGSGTQVEFREGGTVVFSEDMQVSMVPADCDLFGYMFLVTDIFGNVYMSDMAIYEVSESVDEIAENYLAGTDGHNIGRIVSIVDIYEG